jgi:MFS superfamily sulfate permease-like transporter
VTAAGPWLRLTAFAAAASCALVVVGGALGTEPAHRALAVVALPLLVAVAVTARLACPRLVPASLVALVAFLAAAAFTERSAHIVLAGVALAASCEGAAQAFRSGIVPRGSWRDYLTLTKPRIMTLLLLTRPHSPSSATSSTSSSTHGG